MSFFYLKKYIYLYKMFGRNKNNYYICSMLDTQTHIKTRNDIIGNDTVMSFFINLKK